MSSLWPSVFGNDRPVEVEIGPGRGDVLVAFATAHPERNFFAIEHLPGVTAALERRLVREGVPNVRVITADARCVVRRLVPDASVAAYHVYFPDPWPKRRHEKRRLFDEGFAAALARTLVPSGAVHVATDLPDLFALMRETLLATGFAPVAEPNAARPRPVTRFEKKYAAAGTHSGVFARA